MSSVNRQFTLKEGQKFTKCDNTSLSCENDVNTTRVERPNGVLEVELDASNYPIRAVFYYRDKEICTVNDSARPCDLEATFEGQELEDLINSSNDLIDYQRLIADKKQTQIAGEQADPPTKSGVDDPPPPLPQGNNSAGGLDWLLNPLNLLFIPLLFLAIFFVSQVFKALTAPPQTSRKAAAHRRQIQPGATQVASPATTDEIRRQLSTMQSQINQLSTKLGSLETELLVMGQKIESANPKFSQASLPQPPPLPQVPIPVLQRALDLNLLKEAVATSNYSLISNYPHHFVSETIDSRQGKEECVRFSIDGNQDNSQQRAQSEFIAVPYLNETYLIPNILPNATDPARTIKRHVDRNKVYRGDGQNLLNLREIATVERSGDTYVLSKPGQVS